MNDPVILTVAVVLLLLVGVAIAVAISRRRRRKLAERFGPEYDHVVSTHGRRGAEAELEARRDHAEHLPLRELSAEETAELVRRWDQVQARFVDHPAAAVADADSLIGETMRLRGYPVEEVADDERRDADLSATHPQEVGLYRQASEIAQRSRRDEATTEELRQAMMHYRTLFGTLADSRSGEAPKATPERRPERPGEGMTPPARQQAEKRAPAEEGRPRR